MEIYLREAIDEIVEQLRSELYSATSHWSAARTPSQVYDFEQELQGVLNALQARIVAAVLEAIHRDEAFVAACEEQAMRDRRVYVKQRRETPIWTLSGNRVRIRTPHAILPKPVNQRCTTATRRNGTGVFPVLRRLGIVKGATPRFLAEISRQMADGPSGREARDRLANREIRHTDTWLWRRVWNFASIALWQRQTAVEHLPQVRISDKAPLTGRRVVIALDGGRMRIRIGKLGPDHVATRQFSTNKREPKLFAVYTIDEEGDKERRSVVYYDGTLQSTDFFLSLLELRLKQLAITEAELVVIIGDGAKWIWNGAAKLRAVIDFGQVRVVEIIDWAHATSKLALPAKLGIRGPGAQQRWFHQNCRLLMKGEVDQVIAAIRSLDRSHDKDDESGKAIRFLDAHRERMQYARFRDEGLPIGSGIIESGVRRIVNLRLMGASTFWRPENAEAVLYLRCQIKSGRWVAFVKSVLEEWSTDMGPSLREAREQRKEIAQRFLEAHPPVYVDDSRDQAIKWARSLLAAREALIVDTETTGLNSEDEVVQIAIVDLYGKVLLESLFKPTTSLSPDARRVHGITEQLLASAPTFSKCYDEIQDLVGDRLLLAYNADFDRRLLAQTCVRYGLPNFKTTGWDCVMERYASFEGIDRKKRKFKWRSLSYACTQQGISLAVTHDAAKDCLLTLELIKVMATASTHKDKACPK